MDKLCEIKEGLKKHKVLLSHGQGLQGAKRNQNRCKTSETG